MIREPITIDNNRYWMVTTSLDNVTENNKKSFLRKEGSYYKLPIVSEVNYWFSTTDNKIYNPGEYIRVNHGMHFIANKKTIN